MSVANKMPVWSFSVSGKSSRSLQRQLMLSCPLAHASGYLVPRPVFLGMEELGITPTEGYVGRRDCFCELPEF